MDARITGVDRPKAAHILKQIVSTITMQFDSQKKAIDNMALQKIMVNKAKAFDLTVGVSLLIVNLKANMEYTKSHKWGRECRVGNQAIHKKYPDYSHNHDQTLYNNMIQEYVAAGHVWVLCEAPAPSNEQANQVGAFSGKLTALQCAFDDYKESVFSVDKESSTSKKKESKNKKKDNKSRCGRSGDSKSRSSKHHSQSCGRCKNAG